jgi:hypothetical protein
MGMDRRSWVTGWDDTRTVLTVVTGNQMDTIQFDTANADRTRLKAFSRSVN